MSTLHLVLYAPSSVQKLLDFLKTVYTGNFTPVIVKPMGAAAQVGIPEAHKISYKLNKPLIVLPEISDLVNVLGCDCIYYISDEGEEIDPVDLVSSGSCGKIAIMMSSGELEPSRRELEKAKIAWIKGVPRGMPSVAIAGIIVYELLKLKK